MTTKAQMITALKAEYPTLRVGNEQHGYTQLSDSDYEAQIAEWAEARLAKQAKIAEAEAVAAAKLEAAEKLVALGIDPKALGL